MLASGKDAQACPLILHKLQGTQNPVRDKFLTLVRGETQSMNVPGTESTPASGPACASGSARPHGVRRHGHDGNGQRHDRVAQVSGSRAGVRVCAVQELDSPEFRALAAKASRVVTGSLTRHEVRTVLRRREAEGVLPSGEAAALYSELNADIAAADIVIQAETVDMEREFGVVLDKCFPQTPPNFLLDAWWRASRNQLFSRI